MKTIREIRKTTGLSQNQFSDALHIPRVSLKNWEQGLRKCPQYLVELIAYRVEHDPQLTQKPNGDE